MSKMARDNYQEPPPRSERPPDPPPAPPEPPPPPEKQRSMESGLMTFTCKVCGDVFHRRTVETGGPFCSAVCRYARPDEVNRLRVRAENVRLEAKALRRVLDRELTLMAEESRGER